MSEEFDDRLKNHIANVFDNYEDDSAPGGWALLREKYPEEKKRRGAIWLWWGSAAAVLLVVLGLGIWMNSGTPAHNIAQVKPVSKGQVADSIQIKKPLYDDKLMAHTATGSVSADTSVSITQHMAADQQSIQNKLRKKNVMIAAIPARAVKTLTNRPRVKANKTGIAKVPNNIGEEGRTVTPAIALKPNKPQIEVQENSRTDSAVLASNKLIVQPKEPETDIVKPVVKETKSPVFTALKPNKVEPNKPVDSKVKFGVYAATYINYSEGSDNQFNLGAGLSSEIKLAGNFRLSTGISIGQNSFDYKTAIPQKANGYMQASLAKDNGGLIAAALSPATVTYALAPAAPSGPVIRDYQASLLALDIPINLKYQFGKSATYILAGVSSGTYFSETYNFAYNYNSGYLANNSPQSTQTKNSFSTFDFAKTLNFSFGTGYSIGRTRLVIEPFVKYPLGGLGSQEIKFGAGGVNLKLNLSPGKK